MSSKWKPVDVDRAAVVAGLRGALLTSGLSQAMFARAMGTSPSRFSTYLAGRTVPSASLYLRALRLAEALREAGERSWLPPVMAVRGVRKALADNDRVWALRLILRCRDHLQLAFGADGDLSAAWTADPGSTGAEEWDRLLSAVIAHEFEARGLQPPEWTAGTAGAGPWLFGSPFFTTEEVQAATPSWLSDRGIYVSARDLTTA